VGGGGIKEGGERGKRVVGSGKRCKKVEEKKLNGFQGRR